MSDSLSEQHPTRRFSRRVDDYVRFRPRYASEIMAFMRGYDDLLKTYTDEATSARSTPSIEERVEAFFAPRIAGRRQFENVQTLDFEGLRVRLLSTSYSPLLEDARHEPMPAALRTLFDEHQRDERVDLVYRTDAYYSTLD